MLLLVLFINFELKKVACNFSEKLHCDNDSVDASTITNRMSPKAKLLVEFVLNIKLLKASIRSSCSEFNTSPDYHMIEYMSLM